MLHNLQALWKNVPVVILRCFLHICDFFKVKCAVSSAKSHSILLKLTNVNLAMFYDIGHYTNYTSVMKCPVSGAKTSMLYRV